MIGCCAFIVLKLSEGTAKIAKTGKYRIGSKLLKTFQFVAMLYNGHGLGVDLQIQLWFTGR